MRIKGHTEIQLTDVRTGKVKTFHDDNMMTNGLAEFMKNHGMLCGTPFTDAVKNDLINTLLGGILLFDTALTENVNNTRLTDGIKMTANGCQGLTHTGDPTEMGSYDSNESGWQDAQHSVYRHVYTWTTSQGNGHIASVCLTSKPHGFVGEGNSTSKTKTTNSSYAMDTYSSTKNFANGELAFMVLDNETYFLSHDSSDDSLTISKCHICDTECDMRDVYDMETTPLMEEVLTFSNPTQTAISGMTYVCCRILSDSVVVSFKDSNSRWIVLTFDDSFNALTGYVEVTTAATSLIGFKNLGILTMDAEYLVLRGSDDKIYKIDLDNLANVSEVSDYSGWTGGDRVEWYTSGKRHIFGDFVYDETLGAIYPTNNAGASDSLCNGLYKDDNTAFVRADNLRYYPNNVKGGRRNDYLATINNLSSAVTKDSTQTMKVIYTLTFTA